MIPSIRSKFLTLLLSGLSLIGMLFLIPQSAKADTILPTGLCGGPPPTGFGCKDPNYTPVAGGAGWRKTDLSGTTPGFLAAPAGPSGAFWIAPLGDVQAGTRGEVFDIRTIFSTFGTTGTGNCVVDVTITATCITVSGTVAAEGSVSVAVDGVGKYLGSESLTSLGNFSVSVALGHGTTHTLDFIFNGCVQFPSCPDIPTFLPGIKASEPVAALLVDPSWTLAAPGTPLDTIPESVLISNGGIAPSTAVPEPGSLLLLGSGLVAIAGIARRKLPV